MKKPHLIFINHYASIPRWPGPTRNFDFSATLVRTGWHVTLFSCRFNHYLHKYLFKPPALEKGVRLKWIWSSPYHGNSLQRELNILIFSLLSLIGGLWQPATVVITVTPPLESAWTGWLLARLKRVPFVLDVEDLWPDSLISMGFRSKPVIRWLRYLERFLYRHSDHILVVADKMREYLLAQGVAKHRISLVPLGANLPRIMENRTDVRARYRWGDDQVIAVYVGAHGPANALETLFGAAKRLAGSQGLKIVLFGDGSDKARLKMIQNQQKLSNISLEDPLAPEMVPAVLNAADIGIASLKDTATFKTVRPNKLYEYMAVGLPIACCIDGEAKELIHQAGSGIAITPEDDAGLAKVLEKLAKEPELRAEMGQKGRDFVTQTGNRENLALQMDEILKKVIDNA